MEPSSFRNFRKKWFWFPYLYIFQNFRVDMADPSKNFSSFLSSLWTYRFYVPARIWETPHCLWEILLECQGCPWLGQEWEKLSTISRDYHGWCPGPQTSSPIWSFPLLSSFPQLSVQNKEVWDMDLWLKLLGQFCRLLESWASEQGSRMSAMERGMLFVVNFT